MEHMCSNRAVFCAKPRLSPKLVPPPRRRLLRWKPRLCPRPQTRRQCRRLRRPCLMHRKLWQARLLRRWGLPRRRRLPRSRRPTLLLPLRPRRPAVRPQHKRPRQRYHRRRLRRRWHRKRPFPPFQSSPLKLQLRSSPLRHLRRHKTRPRHLRPHQTVWCIRPHLSRLAARTMCRTRRQRRRSRNICQLRRRRRSRLPRRLPWLHRQLHP